MQLPKGCCLRLILATVIDVVVSSILIQVGLKLQNLVGNSDCDVPPSPECEEEGGILWVSNSTFQLCCPLELTGYLNEDNVPVCGDEIKLPCIDADNFLLYAFVIGTVILLAIGNVIFAWIGLRKRQLKFSATIPAVIEILAFLLNLLSVMIGGFDIYLLDGPERHEVRDGYTIYNVGRFEDAQVSILLGVVALFALSRDSMQLCCNELHAFASKMAVFRAVTKKEFLPLLILDHLLLKAYAVVNVFWLVGVPFFYDNILIPLILFYGCGGVCALMLYSICGPQPANFVREVVVPVLELGSGAIPVLLLSDDGVSLPQIIAVLAVISEVASVATSCWFQEKGGSHTRGQEVDLPDNHGPKPTPVQNPPVAAQGVPVL